MSNRSLSFRSLSFTWQVRITVGFTELNSKVTHQLRTWLAEQDQFALARMPDQDRWQLLPAPTPVHRTVWQLPPRWRLLCTAPTHASHPQTSLYTGLSWQPTGKGGSASRTDL